MTGDISGNFIQKVLLSDTSDNLTCVVLYLNGLLNFFTNNLKRGYFSENGDFNLMTNAYF